jgi:translation initiation factor IF-3
MKKRPRINGQIKATEVKVVSEDGIDIGVFTIADALKLVASRREDLVEIEPEAVPPVCQAIDYGKYQFRWLQAEMARRGL